MFNIKDKKQLIKYIIEAIRRINGRGIICGMGEIKDRPNNIIAISSIPHIWLFPKVTVVCCHGGAGTTAAGFKSGVPSVIIPFSNDRFAWAHRAYDLKVGSKPIYKNNLTSDNLVESLNYALQDKIIANAKNLAKK